MLSKIREERKERENEYERERERKREQRVKEQRIEYTKNKSISESSIKINMKQKDPTFIDNGKRQYASAYYVNGELYTCSTGLRHASDDVNVSTLCVVSHVRDKIDEITVQNTILEDRLHTIEIQNKLLLEKLVETINLIGYQPGTGIEFNKVKTFRGK